MSKYKIIALIGEAGSGKDTIMKKVVEAQPNIHEIVSFTTRPPREGEVDGVNYYFVSGENFADKVVNGEMLEASYFRDWFYGTAYDSLRTGCVNIGVFNPDGIYAIKEHKDVDLVVYRIETDSKERLLRQLNRETHPDVDEIVRRYTADLIDFEDLDFHYNAVANTTKEDLDYAVKVIAAGAKMLADKSE